MSDSLRLREAYNYFQKGWLGGVLVFGTIGNLFSLCVFLLTRIRHSPSVIYLASLAVSDTTFLVAMTFVWLEEMGWCDAYIRYEAVCQGVVYVINVCACISTWLVVVFTIERFVVVVYPFHRLSSSSKKHARNAVLATVPWPLLWYSATFFITGLGTYTVTGGGTNGSSNASINASTTTTTTLTYCQIAHQQELAITIFHFLDMIVILIIPLIIIITLNMRIGKELLASRRQKCTLTSQRSSVTGGSARNGRPFNSSPAVSQRPSLELASPIVPGSSYVNAASARLPCVKNRLFLPSKHNHTLAIHDSSREVISNGPPTTELREDMLCRSLSPSPSGSCSVISSPRICISEEPDASHGLLAFHFTSGEPINPPKNGPRKQRPCHQSEKHVKSKMSKNDKVANSKSTGNVSIVVPVMNMTQLTSPDAAATTTTTTTPTFKSSFRTKPAATLEQLDVRKSSKMSKSSSTVDFSRQGSLGRRRSLSMVDNVRHALPTRSAHKSATVKRCMRDLRTTRTLVLVSSVFVLLNLPHNIVNLYEMFRLTFYPRVRYSSDVEYLSVRLATAFYYLNFAINFVLFNIGSSNFRSCAKALVEKTVCVGRRRRRRRNFERKDVLLTASRRGNVSRSHMSHLM